MIDQFLGKTYHATEYNCLHFACELWAQITGYDLKECFDGLCSGKLSNRVFERAHRMRFERIEKPVSPCLVIFHRPKCAPHVGVFYNGRVAHLREFGAVYQPLDVALMTFKTMKFYKCK